MHSSCDMETETSTPKPVTKRHRKKTITTTRNTDVLFGVSFSPSAIRLHVPFMSLNFYRKDYGSK